MLSAALVKRAQNRLAQLKKGFIAAPPGAPPMDPAMMGGAPPMDPAMMGGAPPMDPSMMGGAPPMDPSMMGGTLPMDPAMMGGAPPGGGLPPDIGAMIDQKIQQAINNAGAGGGAGGSGGNGSAPPLKVDQNAQMALMLKMLARISDALGIPFQASDAIVTQDDIAKLQMKGQNGGGGGGGAGPEVNNAIPPIDPINPAMMQGSEKTSWYLLGNRTSKIKASGRAN